MAELKFKSSFTIYKSTEEKKFAIATEDGRLIFRNDFKEIVGLIASEFNEPLHFEEVKNKVVTLDAPFQEGDTVITPANIVGSNHELIGTIVGIGKDTEDRVIVRINPKRLRPDNRDLLHKYFKFGTVGRELSSVSLYSED